MQGSGNPDGEKIKSCADDANDQYKLEDICKSNPAGSLCQLVKGENKLEMVFVPVNLENPVIKPVTNIFTNDHLLPAGIPRRMMVDHSGECLHNGNIATLHEAVLRAMQPPKKKILPADHPV